MKGCLHLVGGMTYSKPLRVFRRRWLLCLIGGLVVLSQVLFARLMPASYQIVAEMIVSSSELLRGVAGAVSSIAIDIARLAFSFEVA